MISKRDKLYQRGRIAESNLLVTKLIVSEVRKEQHTLYNENTLTQESLSCLQNTLHVH